MSPAPIPATLTAKSQPLVASSKVPSRPPAASSKVPSQPPAASSKATSRPVATLSNVASQPPAALSKATSRPAASAEIEDHVIHKRLKLVNYTDISSDEEDYDYTDNSESMIVTKQQTLNSTQLLLFKKGKKLREILLNPQTNNEPLIDPENSKLELTDVIIELSATPIKVIDTKSAEERVLQWKKQESQCDKFRVTAELYNLLYLMSLVQVYDDLIKIGEELKKNPENGIKNVEVWVMGFMRNKLKINSKAEQRNRIGCTRLRKLFDEGITCTQLAQSGLRKCDFFTKKENYEIFLSQIPSLNTCNSISSNSSNDRLSDILDISRSKQTQLYDEVLNKTKKKSHF